MTAIDPQLLEQLSAWMDGELPADEARFLQRRLGNDVALREQWERWQVASASLRRHPLRMMDAGLAGRVAAGIADAANDSAPRRHRGAGWATAAAFALAVILLPRLTAMDPVGPVASTAPPASAPARAAVSPTPERVAERGPAMSPLPSVHEFPLVDHGGKAWPRSPLLADPRLRDGLLIRDDGRWRPAPAVPRAPAQVPPATTGLGPDAE